MTPHHTLLLITSGPLEKHDHLRAACRQTWLRDSRDYGIPHYFVCADPHLPTPHLLKEDVLTLHGSPLYNYLPSRTRDMLRWSLTLHYQWTHVIKCDDDTYLHLPRLHLLFNQLQADYTGSYPWSPSDPSRPLPPYASGGAGYILSRHAAQEVAQRLTEDRGAEDVLVGRHLHAASISLSEDPRFVPYGSDERRPLPTNDLISSHGCSPHAMHDTYQLLHPNTPEYFPQ